MSTHQRHFSVSFVLPISGVSIVNRTGPLVEAWNKKHDRNAAVQVRSMRCDGVTLDRDNAFMHGIQWEIQLCMTGPLANPSNENDITSHLLNAIHAP